MNKIKAIKKASLTLFSILLFAFGALFINFFIFPFQKNNFQKYKMLNKSWKFYINLISWLKIIKVNVEEIDKIQNIKNSIIVSTHPSLLDVVVIMSLIPNTTCFVAEKLARNPFYKGIVNRLFIIEGEENWTDKAVKKLNEGINVLIFPMGSRHKKNEHPRIHRGAASLAYMSKTDIEIINIEISNDFLQKNTPVYDTGAETTVYTIKYIDKIKTLEYINEYEDETTCKTNITKCITNKIYKNTK
ncbi:1-acyl-sn-glycerol-3-phosphate acyltransferase [bacterium]|nr:1-acyl-sn-glycerol-3-phosphate acyltransferase [bacterium]